MAQVPVKKKKQPKNAFYFFMLDFKKREEAKGVRFPNGMKDVADRAAPSWQQLSSDEKWIYEEEARLEKKRDKTDLENKFTTYGKSYAEVERERQEELEYKKNMLLEIKGTVGTLNRETTLCTHTFDIIHVNYYCRQENGDYTPCEIAVAKFNFKDGVMASYHTLINPRRIPLGYKYEAQKLSAETHLIPVPPEEFGGEADYSKIISNIHSFVLKENRNRYLAPYYTIPSSIDAVKNILWKMQDDFQERIEFKIYPLTELFFELRNASALDPSKGFPSQTLADVVLEQDVFNFTRGISCDFHEETDAIPFCSLSSVKRWAFLIMDHCCKDLGIALQPGSHCPKQANILGYQQGSSIPASDSTSLKMNSQKLPFSRAGTAEPNTGATLGVVNARSKRNVLQPLRLPKEPSVTIKEHGFTEEDFPAMGEPKRYVPSGVSREPVVVGGRGRMAPKVQNPIFSVGRGAPIKMEDDFKKLNLK